jgi:hypothetical protein
VPKPLVSCLITNYNFAHLIERALESAFAQDYGVENLEIVVVDDGSTDNTVEVLEPYRDRIRYVYKDNGGLVSSANRAIAEATGEYLALLDADDEWPADKVSRQVAILEERPEVGLVYSDMEIIDGDGKVLEPSYFAMLDLTPVRGRIFGAQLARNYPASSAMLFRASLKPLFHPVDERLIVHDWPIVNAIAREHEVEYIDAPLYRYRMHGANMTLGSEGEQRRKIDTGENAIRRRGLIGVRPGEATDDELAEAVQILLRIYAGIGPLAQVVDVSDAQRAEAQVAFFEGVEAHKRGEHSLALVRLVNAVALDPLDETARGALQSLLVGGSPGGGPVPGRRVPPAALPSRSCVVLAHLDELRREPALLGAFAQVYGPHDDASLLVYAAGWDGKAANAELEAIRAAAGVPAEGGPHLLLAYGTLDAAGEEALARRAGAILTEQPQTGPWVGISPFTRATMPELRLLSDFVAQGPAR